MMNRKGKILWTLFLTAALIVTQLPDTATADIYHVTKDTALTDEDDAVDENGFSSTAGPGSPHDSVSGNGSADSSHQDSGKTVTSVASWTFVDDDFLNEGVLALPGVGMDNQADFDTVVSMLPTQISGFIEGESEPATLDITGWSCPEYIQDGGENWPLSGEYTFTASLPEDYACDPHPTVKVALGGAEAYTINDRFSVDGLRYKELGPDTVQLIGYDGTNPTGSLAIPSSVTKPSNGWTYTVVSIGSYAFYNCSGFTGGLTLPDTLTSIGNYAFSDCSGFTGSLNLPDKLTSIGNYAFSNCGGFTGSFNLPDTLTSIGKSAFYNCSGFTGSLNLPDKLTSIERHAFYNCSGFTGSLNLPDKLTSIGSYAFSNCSGFTGSLNLPDKLTSIEGSAFYNCRGFTGYNTSSRTAADLLYDFGIAANLIQVNGNAYTPPAQPPAPNTFVQNEMKYEITGSNTVTLTEYLQPAAAAGSLTVPKTVTENFVLYTVTAIGDFAFSNCSGFTGGLTLPDTLTHIGNSAFSGCSGFTGGLILPDTLTSIGNFAFYNCSGFTGSLNLPDKLTSIGSSAFSNCSGFTGSLNLPDKLTHIEHSAFADCSGFTGSLNLPDKLTHIEHSAFADCSGFTGSLNLPDKLTYIEDYMFYNCSGFTGSLNLPDTLTSIGKSAFYNCSGFTGSLTLPDNLTHIGEYAFTGCLDLTSAHLGNNLQELEINAFPPSLPLFANSPRIQLLINEYLNHDTIANTAWDGAEDVPDGAVATVKRNAAVSGGKQIGREAEITVPDGVALTVNGALTVDGTLTIDGSLRVYGTLRINGTLTGSGTLYIERGGKAEGDVSGIRVEYPADMEDARKLIESHSYAAAQEKAIDAQAVKIWLAGEIAAISGLKATGVSVGEITVTSFTPATAENSGDPDGTNGSFAFTVTLSKGNSTGQAACSGSIAAAAYQPVDSDSPADSDSSSGSSGISYSEPEPRSSYMFTGDIIIQTISRSDLKKLADSGKRLSLGCDKAGMAFDPAALKAILAAVPSAAGNITFAAAPANLSAFPDAASLIGAHPVYDFTISYKDGEGNPVTVLVNFPAGSASIALSYTPAPTEVTGSLLMVYVDGRGGVTWMDRSCYQLNDGEAALIYGSGRMLAEVPHFSAYGVACKTPVPVFTDIANHWAKEDIEFAAARGWLTGSGKGMFSPDGAMTRGMFVAALGRLAGVNPDSFRTRSFTDVKAGASYAAYVEWAAQMNIVNRTGDKLFSPDAPVTREQMAVMTANCAKQMGYSVPAPLAAAAFADNDKIIAWAAEKIAAMQLAGLIRGKDRNLFDPQETATRAEAAAVLRRFVETVIDPAAAQGRIKNNSGRWPFD